MGVVLLKVMEPFRNPSCLELDASAQCWRLCQPKPLRGKTGVGTAGGWIIPSTDYKISQMLKAE